MTRLRRVLFSVGFPAAGAALLALTITLIVALSGGDAQARPQLIPASLPRPLPLRVPPKHVKPPLYSPFTGERVRSLKPVLAVKIDNIVDARPQTGLQAADLVYVIPVEGGLTRFMAVFSSHVPAVVGPVRSAREDDLNVLRQFGRPAFAWSGAAPHLVPFIERARIADLYANLVGGYYRVSSRAAAGRREGRAIVLGVLSGRVIHLQLVGEGRALAAVDGRRPGNGHRRRPAWRD